MYKHEILEAKLCKELDLMTEKYRTGAEMSEGDLRRIDLLAHAIKSLATYDAMRSAENGQWYSNERSNNAYMNPQQNPYQNSYGPREMFGRNMSRENYPGGNSGYMPYYPEERRW